MASVLKARLEKLACDFPLNDNYFAWQAFARRYPASGEGALPAYLERANYETLKANVGRVAVHHVNFTELLAGKPASSVDRFVLLDAQDWMTDGQLNALWTEITRTASPGARVIFRTAAEESSARSRVRRAAGAVALRCRGVPAISRARPLGDLRRLPPLREGIDMSATAHTHAELMDGVYRCQRHVYDLTRKYYLLGRDRLIEALDVPAGGTVLEIGCGTGRNLVKAARAFPQAEFCGLDISAEMLETASVTIGRRGLSGRVTLARGDAADFDPQALFGRPGFDRVFVSYSLSMIPEWRRTVAAALAAVNDGGSLHGRFRPPGAPARLVEGSSARLAGEIPCQPAGFAAPRIGIAPRRRSLTFVSLYRGYAVYSVLTKP